LSTIGSSSSSSCTFCGAGRSSKGLHQARI
jgi:hypothetical protein